MIDFNKTISFPFVATVHDMFNWLSVCILLPLEAATHALEKLTDTMTKNLRYEKGTKPPEMLKALTKPFTSLIVQVLDFSVVHNLIYLNLYFFTLFIGITLCPL